MRQALIGLSQEPDAPAQIEEIFQADGFAPVADSDFAVVREVEAMVKATRK